MKFSCLFFNLGDKEIPYLYFLKLNKKKIYKNITDSNIFSKVSNKENLFEKLCLFIKNINESSIFINENYEFYYNEKDGNIFKLILYNSTDKLFIIDLLVVVFEIDYYKYKEFALVQLVELCDPDIVIFYNMTNKFYFEINNYSDTTNKIKILDIYSIGDKTNLNTTHNLENQKVVVYFKKHISFITKNDNLFTFSISKQTFNLKIFENNFDEKINDRTIYIGTNTCIKIKNLIDLYSYHGKKSGQKHTINIDCNNSRSDRILITKDFTSDIFCVVGKNRYKQLENKFSNEGYISNHYGIYFNVSSKNYLT